MKKASVKRTARKSCIFNIVVMGCVAFLFFLSACAQESDVPRELGDIPSGDASADIVTTPENNDEQTASSNEPKESSSADLPEPEFIPEDMYSFFGIPDEDVTDSKTYYIQYIETIKVNEDYLHTPVIAIWEAGTNRITIDRMLAKNLVSAIEKKYGYENDKIPQVGAENPAWYHPRVIARISDDKETIMLYQPSIEYYYYRGIEETDIEAMAFAEEFTPDTRIFLNKSFVYKDKSNIIESIDSDCQGYVWREESADHSPTRHYDIPTDTNIYLDADPYFSANACSDDLKLSANSGFGRISVYDIESGKEIMKHNFERDYVYILEFTGDHILYLWNKENVWPIYYLHDFNTGMATMYRERFDISIAEQQFSLFGGYKVKGRYFTTINDKTLKICDRITGKVTEIYSDEFEEGASWIGTIIMDEDFISSFVNLGD